MSSKVHMNIRTVDLRLAYNGIQQRFFALNASQKMVTLLATAALAYIGCLYASIYCRRMWNYIFVWNNKPQELQEKVDRKDNAKLLEPQVESMKVESTMEDEALDCELEEDSKVEADKAAAEELKRRESQKVEAAALDELKVPINKSLSEKNEVPEIILSKPKVKFVRSPHKIAVKKSLCWGWPEDLSVLDVTAKQQKGIDKALRAVAEAFKRYPEFQIVLEKSPKEQNPSGAKCRALVIKVENKTIKKIPIPLKLVVVKDKVHFLLLTKKIIGSGGEREVKICYNLTNGGYLARKIMTSQCEFEILNHFYKNPVRGLPLVSFFLQIRPSKAQVLETLYDGPLSILFGTAPLAKLEQKLSLIHDILLGLKSLHDLTFQTSEFLWKQVKMFHFDIKPDNILVRKHSTKKKWEAVISDFGCSGKLGITGGTLGYRAPEEVKLEVRLRKDMDFFGEKKAKSFNESSIKSHNDKFGQAMDVWATGLVLLSIMTNKTSAEFPNCAIPPLPCIENCFKSIPINAKSKDINLTQLEQKQIDQDLSNLKLPLHDTEDEKIAIEGVLKIIREMLVIDAKKRISANDALNTFQSATATLKMDI
jgi:hypothetical protein